MSSCRRSFEQVLEMHRRIMAVELAEYHRADFEQHRDQYAEGIASLIAEGLSVSAMDYVAALKHRRVFIDDMLRVFGGGPGIWLTPATTSPAPGRESTGDPAFNAPWSYCGFPAISVPCGQTDDGLPIGLQLITIPGHDEHLLHAAQWCEQVVARFRLSADV